MAKQNRMFSLDEECVQILDRMSENEINTSKVIRDLLKAYSRNGYNVEGVITQSEAEHMVEQLRIIRHAVKPGTPAI